MHDSFLRGDLPPATLPSCFCTDATGGYPSGVWDRSLLHVTARPATKAPVTSLIRTGSSLHGDPQWSKQSNTARTATSVAPGTQSYVPVWHFYGKWCGVANGAGPWRCTAGVTPASTRTRDRWTEARTGPAPLCPRNGKRPHTFQGTCDDTASWPPRRPADGQQRAAL